MRLRARASGARGLAYIVQKVESVGVSYSPQSVDRSGRTTLPGPARSSGFVKVETLTASSRFTNRLFGPGGKTVNPLILTALC